MEAQSNAVVVRKYIDAGSSRPTSGPEFISFWKDCDTETRQQYADEVVRLTAGN